MTNEENQPVIPDINPTPEVNQYSEDTAAADSFSPAATEAAGTKKKKPLTVAIAVILAVAIAFTAIFGAVNLITKGEPIDCDKVAEEYNNARPDTSYLYKGATKQELNAEITRLNNLIAEALTQADIESVLYSDEGVSMIAKLLGEASGKEFGEVSFKALQNDYADAFALLNDMQLSSASWEHIKVIPFGLTPGDREGFIKACGAFGKFLGDEMLTMVMKAPTAYDDALVPVLESLHTGAMPSLIGFVMETGLDGSKRVEFLVERVLSIIEPVKEAPIDYLCTMLPDFLTNYKKASEFINGRDLGIKLPDPQQIIDSVWQLLGMTNKPFDLDFVAKLGTATVAESGSSNGKRVEITGDRDDVFMYISDYIDQHVTYENNYEALENFLTQKLKEIDRDSQVGNLLYGDLTSRMLALYVKIVAMNKVKTNNTDAEVLVSEHNANINDGTAIFESFMSRENTAKIINTLDSTLSAFMTENKIENMIFTDTVASFFVKLVSEFCGVDFSEVPFSALSYSHPDAYNYVKALQDEGKTWADVGIIPFGITAGDKQAFVKACGAGAEYFGDLLALNMVVAPTIYDEGLIPLAEAFHIGAFYDTEEFLIMHGADSAKRVEIILDFVLGILEPLKKAPVSYICSILPDIIYGYGILADCTKADPDTLLTGLEIPPLNEFLSKLFVEAGISFPEFDFNQVIMLSEASVAESGDRTGKKMRLDGDKEAVFACLASYVMNIINHENNVESISTVAGNLLGINAAIIKGLMSTIKFILG